MKVLMYQLPKKGSVRLYVCDKHGTEVAELENQPKEAGFHSAVFDTADVERGMYFYRLELNGRLMETRSLNVL